VRSRAQYSKNPGPMASGIGDGPSDYGNSSVRIRYSGILG
jgi:hypothetical protein